MNKHTHTQTQTACACTHTYTRTHAHTHIHVYTLLSSPQLQLLAWGRFALARAAATTTDSVVRVHTSRLTNDLCREDENVL